MPETLSASLGDDQDNFECSKQDRTSLSTTSSTPRSRPRTSARRTQVRRDHESSANPDLGTRRTDLGKTAGVVVMAVLMGLTSWVVASVSTWLVPVYVTAMVLIFVVPRAHHPEGRECTGNGTRPGDRTDQMHRVISPSIAGSSPDASASLAMIPGSSEVVGLETEPPGSVTKPRRVRSRGRKAGQTRYRTSRRTCTCHLDSSCPGQVCSGRLPGSGVSHGT